MARPKRQDERRAHLLAAAQRVIIGKGLPNVRVRDIADAASMSPGTVTYYFRDVQDLFTDIYDQAVERFYQRREHAIGQVDDPRHRLLAMIDSGLPTGPDDELCCLLYEFSPQARHRRGDADMRRTLFDRQVDLYQQILDDGHRTGAFALTVPAREAACNLVALEDAYGYHIITSTSMNREQARQFMTGYAGQVTAATLLLDA